MEEPKVYVLRVSPGSPDGEHMVTVVPNAKDMSNQEMQEILLAVATPAHLFFPAPAGFEFCHFEIRLWAPYYELERCSHAMIGTMWLLSKLGMTPQDNLHIVTKGGLMEARVMKAAEDTDRPKDAGTSGSEYSIQRLQSWMIDELAPASRIQNAGMSTVKTLLPLRSIEKLIDMDLDYCRAKKLCDKVKSTGLYVYVVVNRELQMYEAREFPKDFGSWEDNSVALALVLLLNDFLPNPHQTIRIRQGWAKDRRGEINLRFRKWGNQVVGCWIGGTAKFENEKAETVKIMHEEADTW
ncbi:Phenazine biosynthesis PhzF protein [Penicillium coprophilum]|uniref:Phenazine biosynthesis PhzF protein n=1 Tax=Penicillium coprophilum TaxID=36646 RepID=UPI00238B4A46|nr:Phenazine biosynthesis PhzF protein [Penicillium coprophilum]KAJ5171489.1 Phenazine biosynthesis PhzF protein [Penicillium coprophilum]